jgi:DNA-binding SARP family transcriptional activator
VLLERLFAAAYELFERAAKAGGEGQVLTAAGAMHAVIYALDDLSALDGWIRRAEDIAGIMTPGPQAQARFAVSMFMALVFRLPHHPAIGEWSERAWSACRTLEDAQLRMSAQLLLAINLNYTGQFDRALEFLQALRGQGEATEAPPLERTTLKAVESMYHMLNAQAEPCLRAVFDGLEIADETGVHLWSYHLLSNGVAGALGVGDVDTAAELLTRMQDYAHGARRLDRSGYHYHRAWHAMLTDDLNAARREQRAALSLAEEVGCPFYVVLCRIALVQILAELGDIARADEEVRKVVAVARRISNRLLQFIAWLTLADIAILSGRHRLGLAALRRGLEVGREQGFRHYLGWQPRFMSRVCAAALEAGIEDEYVRGLVRERGLRPPAHGPARARWPWCIEIRTLGGFQLELDGAPATRLSGKPLALLKALVGLGAQRVDESALASLLWPRIAADYARGSLTTALHRLRKLVGEDRALVLRHGRLSLDADLCRLDVDSLEHLLRRIDTLDDEAPASTSTLAALAGELLDLYAGPFMDGERDQAFAPLRERLRNRVLGGLDDLARACERAGEPELALGFYRRAIDQDPLAEAFHRRLMLSLRNLGRAVESVEVYANCKSLIEAARGEPPSAETQAIYEAVSRDI